jgi:asparagine synthase (glutamine-hydrolysing)
MCGIAGILRFDTGPPDFPALQRMSDSLHNRGPDGAGVWSNDKGIALAHRRLAIIDLSERGAQPMASADGALCIVYNGEIYNHPELRRICEQRGAHYRSDSDTETILHLYAQEGPEFVRKLRGMFAFALWDARERSLLLARDPFGIKPLYYAEGTQEFRFASQAKALLAGGVDSAIDSAGVVSFLLWGYVTEPFTWYRQIRSLPAGSMLKVSGDGRSTLVRFCDPLDVFRDASIGCPSDTTLRDALLDSIRHHLLADVPVGLFLSAGIDSGTLCALLRETADRKSVHAVTLGFDEYAGSADDEVPTARMIAAAYGAPHTVLTYRRGDFEEERDRLFAAMDLPTIDGVNSYFVSKAATEAGLKVAISGLGGDELFGGYPSFRQVPRLRQAMRTMPKQLGRSLRTVLLPILRRITSPKYAGLLEYGGTISGAYLLRRALFMPWEIPDIAGPELTAQGLERLDLMSSLDKSVEGISSPYEQVTALEYTIFLKSCLLRDADWAGMAHSLEIRTPLVDTELFTAVALLRRQRGQRKLGKRDFSLAPSEPIPAQFRNRRKTGFNIPIRQWFAAGTDGAPVERGRRSWARYMLKRSGVPCASSSTRSARLVLSL